MHELVHRAHAHTHTHTVYHVLSPEHLKRWDLLNQEYYSGEITFQVDRLRMGMKVRLPYWLPIIITLITGSYQGAEKTVHWCWAALWSKEWQCEGRKTQRYELALSLCVHSSLCSLQNLLTTVEVLETKPRSIRKETSKQQKGQIS